MMGRADPNLYDERSKRSLTLTQRRAYEFICAFLAEHGYAPSYRDLKTVVKRDTGHLQTVLKGLSDAGLIKFQQGIGRSIALIQKPKPGAFHLRFDYSDGRAAVLNADSADAAWDEFARWVDEVSADGYRYVQLSDNSGCAFKAGSTINVTLVQL